MALVRSNADIKKHFSSVTTGLEVESIQSFRDDAIEKHIIPAIGRDFYTTVSDSYAALVAGSKLETAFLILQKAEVNFALAYFSNSGALEISDAGINVTKSDKRLPASDKKMMQFKKQCLEGGYSALEIAIDFLEANLDDFAVYKASAEHKNNRSLFINSSREFPQSISVSAELFASLRRIQADIEEDYITVVLGDDLSEQLHSGILNRTLSPLQEELIKRIRKAVGSLTLAEAIPYKLVTLAPTGAYVLSETVGGISGKVENKNPAEKERLAVLMNKLVCKGEADLEKLRKWLNEHAAEFEGYEESTAASLGSLNSGDSSIYWI